MTKYSIRVSGYSDDNIILTIKEDGKEVYLNEFGTENKFSINNLFAIHTSWDDLSGFVIGLSISEEDFSFNDVYKFSIGQDVVKTYSTFIQVESEFPIVVKGIYGDNTASVRSVVRAYLTDDESEDLIKELAEKGLLK